MLEVRTVRLTSSDLELPPCPCRDSLNKHVNLHSLVTSHCGITRSSNLNLTLVIHQLSHRDLLLVSHVGTGQVQGEQQDNSYNTPLSVRM